MRHEQCLDPEARQRALASLAARFDVTTDAVALAAALARPWADVVLSGAATPAQLKSNLRSLDVSWDEEAEFQARPLAEEPDVYWRKRSDLGWN